jgi:uncharacterized membrane protein
MNWETVVVWAAVAVWVFFFIQAFRLASKKETSEKSLDRTHLLAIDALFIAIIAIMGFVPQLGYLTIITGLSLTLMHIPVLIGAYLFGWKRGLLYGTAFGLTSCLMAALQGTGLNALFIYPWVSVLPRALFGLLAGVVFQLLKKTPKIYGNPAAVGGIAFLLTVCHSVLVFGDLFIFYGGTMSALFASGGAVMNGITFTFLAIIAAGVAGEATLGAIITPLAGKGLLRAMGRSGQ